jgi:hypothetical protein
MNDKDTIEQLGNIKELAEHSLGHIKAGTVQIAAELLQKIASCATATQERILEHAHD